MAKDGVSAKTQGLGGQSVNKASRVGSHPSTLLHGKDKHHLALKKVRAGVEKERTSWIVGMWQQGSWPWWEGALEKKIFWQAEPQWIKFMVQAVDDVLPAQQSFMSGARVILQHVPCAPVEVHWSTSLALLPKPWEKAASFGDRC